MLNVRIPLFDKIAPFGASVLNTIFVFFIKEKQINQSRILVPTNKNETLLKKRMKHFLARIYTEIFLQSDIQPKRNNSKES